MCFFFLPVEKRCFLLCMFRHHRDEGEDMEEAEDNKPRKETSKRVTFALPDDTEAEDTNISNVQKDSAEVKSSFERRQEKVTNRNLRNL